MNSLTIMRLGVCTISSQCVVACTVWSQHAHRPVLLLPFRGSLMVRSLTTPTSASAAAIASGRARGVCPRRNGTPLLRRYRNAPTVPTGLISPYLWLAIDRLSAKRRASGIARTSSPRLASRLARLTVCASELAKKCFRKRATASPTTLKSM